VGFAKVTRDLTENVRKLTVPAKINGKRCPAVPEVASVG